MDGDPFGVVGWTNTRAPPRARTLSHPRAGLPNSLLSGIRCIGFPWLWRDTCWRETTWRGLPDNRLNSSFSWEFHIMASIPRLTDASEPPVRRPACPTTANRRGGRRACARNFCVAATPKRVGRRPGRGPTREKEPRSENSWPASAVTGAAAGAWGGSGTRGRAPARHVPTWAAGGRPVGGSQPHRATAHVARRRPATRADGTPCSIPKAEEGAPFAT